MARYRVTAPTFLQGRPRQNGEVVEHFNGPGFALAPLDAAARRARKSHRAGRAAATAATPAPEGSPSGAPSFFGEDQR